MVGTTWCGCIALALNFSTTHGNSPRRERRIDSNWLFDDPRAARLRRFGRRRRKREGHPDGETIRPVLRGKVPIALEIDVALISFARREHEPDLRSNAKH